MGIQELIGLKIKTLRQQHHLSQTELALKTGYKDKTAISKIEKGLVDLPQSKLLLFSRVNGDEATCKRLKKYNDGIALLSNNPNYEPMYFSNNEILEKPVRIIGKVVELRGKL